MNFNFKDKRRVFLVFLGVVCMGLSLSFLVRVNMGGDPCTYMNLGLSSHTPFSFGTWQALLNSCLIIFVLIFDRSKIGIGTLANMFLVGYCVDFFTWVEDLFLPQELFQGWTIRILVTIPALLVFILAAAVYMSCDLGVAPYDALPLMLHETIVKKSGKKISFRWVRIPYDFLAGSIGFICGAKLGIITILVALFMGPVAELVSKYLIRIGVVKE